MLDLAATLKAAGTLKRFIEDGGLEEVTGSIGVAAAHEAVRKARHAQDPRSQVWSAINHLEEAEQSYQRMSKRRNLYYFNEAKYVDSLERLRSVRLLIAACYRYLGEPRLCEEALRRAQQVRDESEDGIAFMIWFYTRAPARLAGDAIALARRRRPDGLTLRADADEVSAVLRALPLA